jgi:hypothetical protein
MKDYNGHASWDHWNVSLWIYNEEALYRIAGDCVKRAPSTHHAAEHLLAELQEIYGRDDVETPDGAPYTLETLEAALEGFDE